MKQKIAEIINIIFGFRKFILMLALYAIGVIFCVKGLISGGEMVDLFKFTTVSFFGANGVEHVVTCVKEYNAGKLTLAQQANDDVVPPADQEADDAKVEEGAK